MIITSTTKHMNEQKKKKPKLIRINSEKQFSKKDIYNYKNDIENSYTQNKSIINLNENSQNNNILDELNEIKENKNNYNKNNSNKNIINESSKSIKTNIKYMNGSQNEINDDEIIVKDFSKIFELIVNIVTTFLTNMLNYLEGRDTGENKVSEEGLEKDVVLKLPRDVTLIIKERSYNQLKTFVPIGLAILVVLYLKSN